MSKIGIVIPTLSNFKGLAETIASVQTKHTWTPYIIPNWRIHEPVAWAWNYGTHKAIEEGADYIAICNDDILFSKWTLDKMVDYLDKNKNCALVSAVNVRGEIEEDPYKIFFYDEPKHFSKSNHPDFACFMITPKTFDEIGEFDERFRPAYFEDNDYHYRIQLAEKDAVCITTAPYVHFGSQTQNNPETGTVVPSFQFEQNRDYYVRKWGGVPTEEKFTNPFGDPQLTFKEWRTPDNG